MRNEHRNCGIYWGISRTNNPNLDYPNKGHLMVLEVDKDLGLEEKVILPCENCKTPTLHVLSTSHTMYVCQCGSFITIERKEEEND